MKYKCAFFFFFLFYTAFADTASIDYKIKNFINTMSSEEKAAQVLLLGIDGKKEFPQYLYEYYGSLVPGAVILFQYNIADTAKETAEYIGSVKNAFKHIREGKKYIPALFSFDCEGGSVYRLRTFGSKLPGAKIIAQDFSSEEAQKLYSLTAEQIALLGIHLNLAPVAETESAEIKDFFGTRLYSSDQNTVSDYASAFIRGMKKHNIICAVKHFPGSGGGDPHIQDSVIVSAEREFDNRYLLPFKKILAKNDCAVLLSHAKIPFIDDVPFCFSEKGIKGMLRGKLKFGGLVMTDDISMGALKDGEQTLKDKALLALSAGCDMVMCSASCFKECVQAISEKTESDKKFKARIDTAVFTILKTKIKAGILNGDCKPIEKYVFDAAAFNTAKDNADKIIRSKK